MSLKINKFDIIYVFLVIMISFLLIYYSLNFIDTKGDRAIVRYNGKEIMTLDLKENKKIILKREEYPLLLGDMIIEVKDKKIGVIKEESPNNYCSLMGFVSKSGRPIICHPNKIIILIENNTQKNRDIDMGVF